MEIKLNWDRSSLWMSECWKCVSNSYSDYICNRLSLKILKIYLPFFNFHLQYSSYLYKSMLLEQMLKCFFNAIVSALGQKNKCCNSPHLRIPVFDCRKQDIFDESQTIIIFPLSLNVRILKGKDTRHAQS